MRTPLTAAVAVVGLLSGCGSSDEAVTVTQAVASASAAAAGPSPAGPSPAGPSPAGGAALPPPAPSASAAAPASASAVPPPAAPASSPTAAAPAPVAASVVQVSLRTERRTQDAATQDFDATVRTVLHDARGWGRAGFAFAFDPQAPYVVVLAEPAEVDRLCAPYRTGSRYSCQNGSVVALNADRWRTATPSWPGSLADYRTMLVNHEVGHLLGQHHPEQFCGSPGEPAAVMAQQSTGLKGCTATLWPLEWEVSCAARHDEPLAPPYEASSPAGCGPRG